LIRIKEISVPGLLRLPNPGLPFHSVAGFPPLQRMVQRSAVQAVQKCCARWLGAVKTAASGSEKRQHVLDMKICIFIFIRCGSVSPDTILLHKS
jgi:hypothetical protein